MDSLVIALSKLRRRLSLHQWLYFTVLSLVYSSSLSCLWLLCTRLFPGLGNPIPICGGLVVLGFVVAAVLAWVRRPLLIDAALAADRRLGLKERFTSSLELAQAEGPMISELHADARAHLGRLNVRRDFPMVGPKNLRWAYVPLLLFGVAYLFLPELDLFGFEARRAEARAKIEKVRMRVQRLKKDAKPLEEAAAVAEGGPLADAAALVDRVTDQLDRGVITEKQALAKLTDLRDALQRQYAHLNESNPRPKLAKAKNFGVAQDIASAIQKDRFGDAAQKVRELQKKLKEGNLSKQELEAMAQDLQKLARLLGVQNAVLAEALAEAAQCLEMGNCEHAAFALADVELSLEDLASILEQLDQLAKAGFCLGCCMNGLCGGIGPWRPGESDRFGRGMGGPGHGRGGGVGDLPDVNGSFDPSLLPGPMTQGKILMSIEQRAAPEEDAEPTIDYIQGAFIEARQEAEQALEQEEIPRGSREFVRQYFGTLEAQEGSASPSHTSAVQ